MILCCNDVTIRIIQITLGTMYVLFKSDLWKGKTINFKQSLTAIILSLPIPKYSETELAHFILVAQGVQNQTPPPIKIQLSKRSAFCAHVQHKTNSVLKSASIIPLLHCILPLNSNKPSSTWTSSEKLKWSIKPYTCTVYNQVNYGKWSIGTIYDKPKFMCRLLNN